MLKPAFEPELPKPDALPANSHDVVAAYRRLYNLASHLAETVRSFAVHCDDVPSQFLPPRAQCWIEATQSLPKALDAGLVHPDKPIPDSIFTP